ncbi:Rieske (2Fe-2S) protein [Calditrichota bacterium GD2]
MAGLIKVAHSEQIKENKPFALTLEDQKIVLIRHQGRLLAFKDSCPHQGAPLSHGFVRDGQITCIYHGWKFNLDDGSFSANEKLKLKSYAVREENGEVFLELP